MPDTTLDPSASGSPPTSIATLPLDEPRTPIRGPGAAHPPAQPSEGESDDDVSKDELPQLYAPTPPTIDDSQQLYMINNSTSTPLSKIMRNFRTQGGNIEERKNMEVELGIEEGKGVKTLSLEDSERFYHDLASGEEIDKYLTRTRLYSRAKKCWSKVPQNDPAETALYEPLVNLTSDIINRFKPDSPAAGVTRKIVKSDRIGLVHENEKWKTSPDICVQATGPSFGVPKGAGRQAYDLGYTNVASVFDAKTEKNKGSTKEQAKQLGVYSMQICIQQPNRNFVRALIITEKHARMFHFDRRGTWATPYVDIHDASDPEKKKGVYLFVRWVLGLSSYAEKDLGLDTSVQWTIDDDGKKVAGTITVQKCDEVEEGEERAVVYELNMDEPPIVRASLTGRGTVIWNARGRDGAGEQVMIKDSWRAEGRAPESEYMEKARELKVQGIAEIVGFQDYCSQTKDYRPTDFGEDGFPNRIKLRMVMRKYGLSIWYFRSRIQLLQALLAAILAHARLFKNKILHRDISMQNIVLGLPTSDSRGYLIDLDMAIDISIDRNAAGVGKDERTGLMMYQSYFTLIGESLTQLKKLNMVSPPPHDYLDDVECFFWILCHIMYTFDRPGGWSKELPKDLKGWAQGERPESAKVKKYFLQAMPALGPNIPEWWGKNCETLLEELAQILHDIQAQKTLIFEDKRLSAEEKKEARDVLINNTTHHLGGITKAFEKAILGLNEEGLCAEERVIYQLSPDAASQCLHFPLTDIITVLPFEYRLPLGVLDVKTSVKRGVDEDEDEGGPAKRNRHGSS